MDDSMLQRLTSLLLFLSLPISAELYQWTDANGKLHFGDRPPSAETSKLEVNVQNNDFELLSEDSALHSPPPQKNQMTAQQQKKQEEERRSRCLIARSELTALNYSYDKELTEKKRAAKERKWKKQVQRYCS